LDGCFGEVYLLSTASTVWPEQGVAPNTDLGGKPKVPSNSQISRMSVKGREQEMPPELAATMIIEETRHETRDLIEDTSQEMKEQLKVVTMPRPIVGTNLELYETGENDAT
jgi:hypothetical protein